MAMSTPWGPAQTQTNIARGIVEVTTASHGGIRLSPTLNARVHEAWREPAGWYEEDCDWAKAVLTFPQHFAKQRLRYAHESAKRNFPAEYARVMGEPVAKIVAVGRCPRCGAAPDATRTRLRTSPRPQPHRWPPPGSPGSPTW